MAKNGAKLSNLQKLFVLKELARFRTPQEVATMVKEEFGIEVTRQSIFQYNPDRNPELPEKWRKVFAEERAKFKAEVDDIAIAHQPFRLEALEYVYRKAKERGNHAVALQALEQAAKERGGLFTNRREGLNAQLPDVSTWTDEQLEKAIAGEDLRKVFAAGSA